MLPAHIILVTLTSLIVMAVGEPPPRPDDPGRLFKEAGVTGTFLLYNMQTGQTEGYSPERWDSACIPASTFKIFNALVALETSVVPDETTTVAWDGVQRTRPEWNRDQNLASAFRTSAVWFFQRLARLIGPERMQAYLDSVGYGNRIMGGPIDMFWLSGGLRISPSQQVQFLRRLYTGDLPFSARTMSLVKKIMIREQTPSYTLRAKTGLSDAVAPAVGWYVGYVERQGGVYVFAMELDIQRDEDVRQRVDLTQALLRHYGVIP